MGLVQAAQGAVQLGGQHIAVGTLGIGLLPAFLGQDIGRQLLTAAIATAWSRSLSRIELTVRADNHHTRALYEQLGFEHEGVQRRAFLIEGQYFDCHAMALLRGA